METLRAELDEARHWPARQQTTRPEDAIGRLGINPERFGELAQMAGPESYEPMEFDPGLDLFGHEQRIVTVGLERAIRTTAANNHELRFARLSPAIRAAQVTRAEAAFDWVFFTNADFAKLDQPRPSTLIGGQRVGTTSDQRDRASLTSGLRRQLTTGGQLSLQHELIYTDVRTPGVSTAPDPAKETAVTIQLDQPLLRGFGSDVTLTELRLERNAERNEIAELHARIINQLTDVERVYWQLTLAHRNLLVTHRNMQRGETTLRQLVTRREAGLEVAQTHVVEARRTVEERRVQYLEALRDYKSASDRLKLLMNDPEYPVSSEVMLLPADDPLDAPVQFSLPDLLISALEQRPEIRQSLLSLDNTSLRLAQANNARLPQLNLRLQTRLAGLEDDYGSAYRQTAEGKFVDYLFGLQFEQPIGNRAGESLFRQRRLEQMQAAESYQNTVKQVIVEVKGALHDVRTNYELILQARLSRLAATESLRVHEFDMEQLRIDQAMLREALNRQESLARAEIAEFQALAEYNNAISNLYAAIGKTLERNQIQFVVPNVHPDEVQLRR